VKFEHALIATKAWPLHLGHALLIDKALEGAEKVTVLVVWGAGQQPSGEIRAEWVRKAYPQVDVRLVADIFTDDSTPESSELWADYAKDILSADFVDAVYSSEAYGVNWAKALGVLHIMVDPYRTYVPISGTEIRANPMLHWQYIHPVARPNYLKRILIVGAESTGKTTLCKKLSERFSTRYVPEFGRIYVEQKGSVENANHRIIFGEIVNHQSAIAKKIEAEANRVVFHDTDLITTALFYKQWQPDDASAMIDTIYEASVRNEKYDLVFVLDHVGTEWIQDGLRDQDVTRAWFTQQLYEQQRTRRDCPVIFVTGQQDARCDTITKQVEELIDLKEMEEWIESGSVEQVQPQHRIQSAESFLPKRMPLHT